MTDQPTPEGTPGPEIPSAETPSAPPMETIATPPPMPPPAPMMAPPPVAPPPAVAWQAPPPIVAAKGSRTMLAVASGILLILLAIGGGLIGLLLAVFGSSVVAQMDLSQFGDVGGLNDPGAVVSGVLITFGIVIIVYSLVYLIAGIGVLRSRGWGRVLGIIVGILSGLFWVLGLTGNNAGGGLFVIVLLAIHVYIVVTLLFFWRSKATA